MKKILFISGMLIVLMAVIIPVSVLAQHKSMKVMVHKEDNDSILSNSFFSTMFDVEDIGEMHKKLDSILSTLDKDLDKRIRVMAFNRDSMFNQFSFSHNFDGNIDSIMSMHKLSTNDKRIEELIKSYRIKPGNHVWVLDNKDLDSTHLNGMNIEVITDSVTENGKTVIRKEIIVESDHASHDAPLVIKRFSDKEGGEIDEVIAYKHQMVKRRPGEHFMIEKGDKRFKTRNESPRQKVIEEIPLSDAELLVRGGVSTKVIVAEPLQPKNIEVHIKVKEEYGKEVKTVGLSLSFEDTKDIQVKILNKDGHILFEETKKKFTGTYKKDIEMNEVLSPYYFVLIRGKKMFGRILKN